VIAAGQVIYTHRMKKTLIPFLSLLVACQRAPEIPVVIADVQTENCLAQVEDDAADDPAFWLNEEHPEQSLIFGTNKTQSLEVYNLQGKRLANYPIGRLNNVDVALSVALGDTVYDIVAASNRDFDRIDVWAINADATKLTLISDTSMKTELSGVYGFCLWNDAASKKTYAFINNKEGDVEQWELVPDSTHFKFQLITSFQAEGQVEGMVVDYDDRILYLGEEQGGVFAYNLDNMRQERIRIPLSGDENKELAYDIEGLAVYSMEDLHLLVTSSQGNNRYAVYNIDEDYAYLGVFGVADAYGDRTQETDGIDIYSGAVGDIYPAGIFMCQDGFNYDVSGTKEPQNFKITNWRSIEQALVLK
jgi:3-phytase